jgi:hypothetical protein
MVGVRAAWPAMGSSLEREGRGKGKRERGGGTARVQLGAPLGEGGLQEGGCAMGLRLAAPLFSAAACVLCYS